VSVPPGGRALGLAVTLALAGCEWSSTCSSNKITTESLPDATLGQPYAFTLSHDCAGKEAATWVVLDGQLPPGIELSWDGRLFGAATEAGRFSVRVLLSLTTRGLGGVIQPSGSDSRAYTLTVRP
jgi:hypothetical protein